MHSILHLTARGENEADSALNAISEFHISELLWYGVMVTCPGVSEVYRCGQHVRIDRYTVVDNDTLKHVNINSWDDDHGSFQAYLPYGTGSLGAGSMSPAPGVYSPSSPNAHSPTSPYVPASPYGGATSHSEQHRLTQRLHFTTEM